MSGEILTKISVIVPIYNTEEYLSQCLDSVINQTFEDIEIICVNDGSTDNSLEILKEYQENYPYIKLVNHEHKGPSASRNIGMEYSDGDYILFLDSDDYLDLNAIEELYNLMEEKSLDLLLFKLINFDAETHVKSSHRYFEMDFLKNRVGDNVFNYEDVKDILFEISVTGPGKMYKRTLIENKRFKEGLIFEDNAFFAEVIFDAKKVYFYDRYLYFRRIRKDSITNSFYDKFSDSIEIYKAINDTVKEHGKYDEVKGGLFNRQSKEIFLRYSQVPEEFKEDFYIKIKNYFKSKLDSYDKDGTFDVANKRSKEIFFKAIETETYKEYELSIEVFDLKQIISKLKRENRKLKNQINNNNSNKLKKFFKH